MSKGGPRFSEAARAAAAAKRRERANLAALNFHEPSVFILRAPAMARGFLWEIRMFGGISLETSQTVFDSAAEARAKGAIALDELKKTGRVPWHDVGRGGRTVPAPTPVQSL